MVFILIYPAVKLVGTMAASHPAESETVFSARLDALGLTDLKERFVAKGWVTFADFAMAASDFSGKDPALFKVDVLTPLVGDEEARVPNIRRLFVQAYAAHTSLMDKIDAPAPERPAQMHPLDRDAATKALKARIRGLNIQGDGEPSFALINRMSTVLQHGVIRYAGWETLTSRIQEINDVSEVPGLKLVDSGSGVSFVPMPANEPNADLSGEMRWDLAIRRRGLAMDVAGLLTYESHMAWHERMRMSYLREPPPGYRKPDWAQLRNADRELWTRVADGCSAGCKPKPGATKTTFEEAWEREMISPEVGHFLLPLPGGTSSSSPSSTVAVYQHQPQGPDRVVRRLENELKQARLQIAGQKRRLGVPSGGGGGGGGGGRNKKGKGNGKGKGDKGGSIFMADFVNNGNVARTKSNDPICFNYNLASGCTLASPGQRCPKGLHVCSSTRCQEKQMPHSATSH